MGVHHSKEILGQEVVLEEGVAGLGVNNRLLLRTHLITVIDMAIIEFNARLEYQY